MQRRAGSSGRTKGRAQALGRIRPFLVNDGAGIVVVWVDRGQTDLAMAGAMVTISTGRHYDDVLEELRRQNLRPVDDV